MVDNYFKKPGETKNIVPKILAIIMAIVLWMYVMNEQNPPYEATFTLPIEVRNAATSYVVSDVPETVKVKVRGPRNLVAGVLNKDLKAFVDVKGLTEGRHAVAVSASIPSNLELLAISPDKVQVTVDATISRQIPVEIRVTGTPEKGAVTGKITAANQQVTIEGPRNIVGMVEKVLATIDLTGKSSDVTTEAVLVPVNRAEKEVEGVAIYPEKTKVTINLTTTVAKKQLDIKPVTLGELPTGLVIKSIVTQPEKIEVTETVPGKGFDKLESLVTEPVNLGDISKDTDKEVKVQLPEGITGTTKTVVVKIKVGPR